jgi:NAD(P)-dependent dehydrogenase (short-subunit alcohol dehydrogenase family)
LDEITAQDFENIYRINIVAPFLLSKAAAAEMQPAKGLTALTKAWLRNHKERNSRKRCYTEADLVALEYARITCRKLRKFGESTPIGRPGQPVELSPLYVLLASDEASYITGEIYGVTAGQGIA